LSHPVHEMCSRNQSISQSINQSRNFYDTIRYDTIEEFNVDSKGEYGAWSSTRRWTK